MKIINMLCALALVSGCNTDTEKKYTILSPIFSAYQKCNDLKIGGQYQICCCKDPNPFEKVDTANVVILNMKKGYVQYCRDYDFYNQQRITFTRSCEDFTNQINQCKVNP